MNERFTCSKINKIVTKAICEMRVEKGFCNPDECPVPVYDLPLKEIKEGNHLKPEKRSLVKDLISQGKGNRLIERETGISKNTIKKIRNEIISQTEEEPLCECGKPATHKGWCAVRFKKSPKRQTTMKKIQNKNKSSMKKPPKQKDVFQETVEAIELSERLNKIQQTIDSILNSEIDEMKMKIKDIEIQLQKIESNPIEKSNIDITEQSFEKIMLSKYPSFDPTWEDTRKISWLDGFKKVLNILSPRKTNFPKADLELELFEEGKITPILRFVADDTHIYLPTGKDDFEALQNVRKFIEQFPIDINKVDSGEE